MGIYKELFLAFEEILYLIRPSTSPTEPLGALLKPIHYPNTAIAKKKGGGGGGSDPCQDLSVDLTQGTEGSPER